MKGVKIYHLYHSGVAIEVKNELFIFDFYRTKNNKDIQDIFPDFANKKAIYVFVSHGHADHFSEEIFDWTKYNDNLNYILSFDIKKHFSVSQVDYLDVDQYKEINSQVKVTALSSTDRGVSFLLELPQLNIFHSGDLNWWHWDSFSDSELQKEETGYKNEIKKIESKQLDIAFVPVDPRLGEYYYLAGEYFIDKIKPDIFVPIHFGDKYSIVSKFRNKTDQAVQIPEINEDQYLIYDSDQDV